jgi:hypothetical protein
MEVALLLLSSVGLAMGTACDNKKSGGDAPVTSASAAPVAATPPSATTPPPPPPAAPNGANVPSGDPMATLIGTMATELKSRPGVHPSVDDGFAAFAKAGVPIIEPKQSLGTTYKASYCSHGLTTAKDLSVLLCEYPDEARAAAGFAESKKLFTALSTRQTMSRKTLLLATIFQLPDHSASATAAQKTVVATFNAL